ncbi:3'-5' exoribonuclease [Dyella jiangningensis]|uniref:3'-5' exoribonuclease n=1 Tax=Dyella jiangningensis TaxID=1379159 RepID=UPI00240FE4AD|nr:3'-5' exoribonuclease [Dyella jiangningensis]MDG2539830.1 3'-5' exoribonuclease [Dyella jiangningensis]
MDLFLDCEWADIGASELVSLALVSSDGEHVFYAERENLPEDPTPWVSLVVYPLLDRGHFAMSDADMTQGLRAFLARIASPCICYDFETDRRLCEMVIKGTPGLHSYQPIASALSWLYLSDIRPALDRWWSTHSALANKRHHALVDAQALRAAYLSQWGI